MLLWSWRRAQDQNGDVWVRNKDGDLVKVDWQPGQPRTDAWDTGHVPGREYRDLRDDELFRSRSARRMGTARRPQAHHPPCPAEMAAVAVIILLVSMAGFFGRPELVCGGHQRLPIVV